MSGRRKCPRASASRSYARDQRRTLGALVVTDFDVPILPSAEHWWDWRDSVGLGAALAEAGHLLVGYGIPWLAGELEPPP